MQSGARPGADQVGVGSGPRTPPAKKAGSGPHRPSAPLDALAHPGIPEPRGSRDRRVTEAELEAAALRLIARDGILAGLNLREVASEAGINRALVYQYFGSRRALIRSALSTLRASRHRLLASIRFLPFVERRSLLFRSSAASPVFARVEALLALDGDEDLVMFATLPLAMEELEQDKAKGDLATDLDTRAVHALTISAQLGYCVFRENLSRELGLDPEDLDARAEVVFTRMLQGLAPAGPAPRQGPSIGGSDGGSIRAGRRRAPGGEGVAGRERRGRAGPGRRSPSL